MRRIIEYRLLVEQLYNFSLYFNITHQCIILSGEKNDAVYNALNF